jgi:hypothetical protein
MVKKKANLSTSEYSQLKDIGEDLIRQGKVCVVILAGG